MRRFSYCLKENIAKYCVDKEYLFTLQSAQVAQSVVCPKNPYPEKYYPPEFTPNYMVCYKGPLSLTRAAASPS